MRVTNRRSPWIAAVVFSLLGLTALATSCSDDASDGGLGFPDGSGADTVGADAPGIPGDDVAAPGDGGGGGKPDAAGPDSGQPGEDVVTPAEDVPGPGEDTGGPGPDVPVGEDTAPVVCSPGERLCLETDAVASHAWYACNADGTAWGEPQPCADDEVCLEGVCLAQQCEPGRIACAEAAVLVCTEDGLGWTETACEEGLLCFAGACVECVNADQCGPGETCGDDGLCAPEDVVVRPPSPPIGTEGEAYAYAFEARGGLPPYAWSAEGALPPGLALSAEGVLQGTPGQAGTWTFTVLAEDAHQSVGAAEAVVTIEAAVDGVHITTASPLPEAEEGEPYDVQLQAAGGTPPYAWLINSGELPAGLRMEATGRISGTPDMAVGDFPIRVRVFDNSEVPTWDQRELLLRVKIAPLEIIGGEQRYDLLVTKVIVLPLLTFIPGVPLIGYDTQLQAKGGLRPYHWTEQPIPDLLTFLIPRSGVPEGLVLEANGRLHGNVSSTEEVIEITIPFTQIVLRGFFFLGEVADSQDPAAKKTALFLIPTLPIGAK